MSRPAGQVPAAPRAASPPDPQALDLGQAILTLRGDRSQAACAVAADLDATAWSLFEAGKRCPKPSTLLQIREGLGVSELEFELARHAAARRRLLRHSAAGEAAQPTELARARWVLEQLCGEQWLVQLTRAMARQLMAHLARMLSQLSDEEVATL